MENNDNKQKLKELNSKKDESLLFSTSLIFDQNIDKLWLYLRDLNSEAKNIDYMEKFQYIKGDNTWIPGNICSINWIGLTHLEFKCISTKVDRTKKIIKWKGKGDIGINFYKILSLYRITQTGKTLVKSTILRTEIKNELIDITQSLNYYLDLEFKILLSISKYLQNFHEDIISFESCIINKNYLQVWKFISDFKKMTNISTFLAKNPECNTPIIKPGSFIKYHIDELKVTVYMKIIYIETFKKKKCWFIRLETIGANIENLPKLIEYKIQIINENKTQLSIMHKFPYNINQDFLKKFQINKKETLKKYKAYIEENNENEEKIILDNNNNYDNNKNGMNNLN